MENLGEWLGVKNAMAFRVFSSTDASDLPTGWTKPTAFPLDGAIFYDGNTMVVFTDEVPRIRLEGKTAKTHRLNELQSWLDTNKGVLLVGYGSLKFDSRLLLKHHNVSGNHLDLSEVLYDASQTHYGNYGRRYDLRSIAIINRMKQTPIPHFSFLMKPVELLIEWRAGLSRNVMKTLAAETELIAKLFQVMAVKGEIRINDERTEHPVSVPCALGIERKGFVIEVAGFFKPSEYFIAANEEE